MIDDGMYGMLHNQLSLVLPVCYDGDVRLAMITAFHIPKWARVSVLISP